MNSETRTQKGQEFRKSCEINVGDVVWTTIWDPEDGKTRLAGPYFVLDFVHKGRMSEHLKLFSTHDNQEIKARYGDIYVPIIDKIDPPAGHNLQK